MRNISNIFNIHTQQQNTCDVFNRFKGARLQQRCHGYVTNFLCTNYSKYSHVYPFYNHVYTLVHALKPKNEWVHINNSNHLSLPKKLVRQSFLKHFANNLTLPATLASQTYITADYAKPTFKNTLHQKQSMCIFGKPLPFKDNNATSSLGVNFDKPDLQTKDFGFNTKLNLRHNASQKSCRLMKAEWIMQDFIENAKTGTSKTLALKRSIGQIIRQADLLISTGGTSSPIQGLAITITGRISNKKKAMAQKFTRSVGRVPLSSLNQRIDYSQRCIQNKFGTVGVKIWVCYN